MTTRPSVRPTLLASISLTLSAGLLLSGCSALGTDEGKTPDKGSMALVVHPENSPGSDMVKRIDGAKKRVWMEMYSLKDDDVIKSLIAAKDRGVDVRVMLHHGYGVSDSTKASYATLTTNKVATKWAPTGYIFHIKTTLIDDAADISSANLNVSNYSDHRDFSVIDADEAHVKAIADTFNKDWQLKGKPAQNTVKADGLVWSPNAQDTFVNFIKDAKKTIDFSSEEMKGLPVATALADASRRGVTCRVHLPDEFGNDQTAPEAMNVLKNSKCKVSLLSASNSATYAHAKQIIVDESKVLVGSQNNSMSSLTKNRELSVIVTDKNIVDKFTKTFSDDEPKED